MNPEELAKTGSEDGHQAALFAWASKAAQYGFPAAWNMETYASKEVAERLAKPCENAFLLHSLFAIPNGGQRHKAVAAKLKATGVKSGVPDMMLPVVRVRQFKRPGEDTQYWHGLYIELKKIGGKPSPEQIDWNRILTQQGYRVYLCEGWRHAAESIQYYLEGNDVYEVH